MTKKISVALAGAGAMGGALLKSWLARDIIDAPSSVVFEPAADKTLKSVLAKAAISLNPEPTSIAVDALILAVKPQAAPGALPAYARIARSAIVISVMAGRSLASIARILANPPRIARAMPNLPASIGAGVTGLYAPATLNPAGRDIVDRLMACAGETVWLDDERAIDFVTAVSGAGPAYFFLLVEALAEAGVALGLDRQAAQRLARASAVGAGALLDADPRSAAEMRKAVTSPGGVTAAALAVLDGDEKALRALINEAVTAAAKRAGELTD